MKNFASKILLFGEYAVIKGANALLVPYNKFSARLEITSLGVDESLYDFSKYICRSSLLSSILDIDKMTNDINDGLRFLSSIPQGMGLGSSGALCASFMDRYLINQNSAEMDLALLQEYFSLMESFFHGKSSGVDPLVSYFGKAILIDQDNRVHISQTPKLDEIGHVYLLNSNIQRKTAPLVHQFLSDFNKAEFKKEFETLIKYSNDSVKYLLEGSRQEFLSALLELSKIQLKCLRKMIPSSIYDIWSRGLESNEYIVKFCGAGGGGYFLCFSHKKISLDDIEYLSII